MGWDDDDEAGSDPAESDPVNKKVNKLAKAHLSHDLYYFLQYQDWSPISFTRICNDRHSDVIKQYMKYSHQCERTCTERGAIRALQKDHEHITKIIYSLIECCGSTVVSTDDDVDVDVDADDAVAVPIPASGIEEDPVEAVVVTQSETPDTSDLISSGNQYLVAFTEAMINMAKKIVLKVVVELKILHRKFHSIFRIKLQLLFEKNFPNFKLPTVSTLLVF